MEIKSKFTPRDFDDMRYNVAALTENQTVLGKFSELKQYPEFNDKLPAFNKMNISVDKIFRYCILMYSDNVIHRLIPEFAHRKREAAILAKFEPQEDGRFREPIEKMFRCEYDCINDIIVRVIMFSRSSKFQRYLTYNEAMFASQRKLIDISRERRSKDEKTNEKTKEILQTIEDLAGYLEDLERQLTNEDTNTNLLDKLYSNIEGINLGIRPEEIALARKQGKLKEILKEPK